MNPFAHLSLKRKQMLVVLVTVCTALVLACASLATYEVMSSREALKCRLQTVAGLVGVSTAAALQFDDAAVAGEVLSTLCSRGDFAAACLYTADRRVFAKCQRGHPEFVPPAMPRDLRQEEPRFENGHYLFFRDINFKGETVGTVYLQSDPQALTERLRQYVTIALIVLLLSLGVALALSSWLQRFISGPILDLVQAVRSVARDKNYTVRVPKQTGDELGGLIDDFNEMLGQIQARDAVLQQVQGQLEERVVERTRELQGEVVERQRAEEKLRQLHHELQTAYDELRATQQTALQQERLRALGQMASGIAHDINNALAPVLGFAELLQRGERNLSAEGHRCLETIKTAAQDIARTVGRMREFYRQREGNEPLLPLQVNKLVQEAIDLVRPRWRDIPQEQGIIINLQTDLDARIPAILGTESEIRQALVNLMLNAIDAMPEGGVLTLRTRQAPPAERQVAGTVLVEVVDTGVGMDEETRRRCLEPFYSTKGLRGTGLGLAMVFGAMERHGGSIAVESAPGQGTTMQLAFPAHTPAPAEPAAEAGATLEEPSLRILCIDDEPMVLEILKRLLQELGHQVDTATSGEGGVNCFRAGAAQGNPFDVVITDLGMPKMDGRTVARTIKAQSPNTPIILLTGWGMFLKAEDRALARVDLILAKPPSIKDLQQSLVTVRRRTLPR